MINTVNKDSSPGYPFQFPPGEVIGMGTFWGESKVMEHGDEWVVKETISASKNTVEVLKENKADYELFRHWLGKYIPETQFIRGQNTGGEEVNLVRQRRIRGKSLQDFSLAEIDSDNPLHLQITDFFEKCILMWEKVGRIPDLTGIDEPFRSRNIIVEEKTGELFLVDTSASADRFSKQAMILFRLRAQRQVNRMKKLVENN